VDGFNLGVLRTKRDRPAIICNDGSIFSADHSAIRAVVAEAGESMGSGHEFWFAHPAGFLFCHGSKKALAQVPSKVDPMKLIEVLVELLGKDGNRR